jgi:hypothetical protein
MTPDRYSEDLYRNFSQDVQHNPFEAFGFGYACDLCLRRALRQIHRQREEGCRRSSRWVPSLGSLPPRQIAKLSNGKGMVGGGGGGQLTLHAVAGR